MIDLNDVRPVGFAPIRFDLDEIVQRLRGSVDTWVPAHFPNGRRMADEWRLANIRGGAPRKQGSCVITLKGEHAGDWIDFDGNQGGGPISALEYASGLSGRALIEYAAEVAGSVPFNGKRYAAAEEQPLPDRRKDAKREIDFVLSRTAPLAGTIAETYLRSRGLAVPATEDLVFHPDLTYWDTRTGHPAMVALVRDAGGETVAIHRTYLAEDGSGKADLPKPRMMLGPVGGGAVRLAPVSDDGLVGIAEGIETGLAVMQACPRLPVWAALSAGNIEQLNLPSGIRSVVILVDNDPNGTGLAAAERAAQRFHGEGRRVWTALPPRVGDDFDDVLCRDGIETVKQAAEAAVEWTPSPASRTSIDRETSRSDDFRPVGFQGPRDQMPRLRADDGDLPRLASRAWGQMLASNDPPWLFRAAGRPSWIERDEDGRPFPYPMTEDRVRHIVARLAVWLRMSRNGDLVPAHPPMGLVKDILATPNPALPVLAGVVTAPVFGVDGTLITTPGYHPATRLLYEPQPGFELQAIPDRPDAREVAAARALLLDEMLGEFPFGGQAERAHALALLLLPFVRPMIKGPTPLHLIEKPAPGTGATLMVDAISMVVTGIGASVMVEGRDEEEWRKRLTAKLRTIPTMLLIDNLRRTLDSSSVAAALTAPYWEDRILGKSEMTRFPVRCVWVATGNNPQFSNELARRLVRIRLDAHIDQPWLREGFRHPDLLGWVSDNRSRLVAACLTLGCAWIAAGRPRHGKSIGSFESWSHVIGGILEVAGVDGFLANLGEMYETADAEGAVWRVFIAYWWDRHGTGEVGTAELHELALSCEPPLPLGNGNEQSQRTRLGQALRGKRDRVFDVGGRSVRLEHRGERKRAQRWRLTPMPKPGEPGEPYPVAHMQQVSLGEPHPRVDFEHSGEPGEPQNQGSPQGSPEISQTNQSIGEPGEPGEPFSDPYARTDTHTHSRARESAGKGSPGSPGSPPPVGSTTYRGEPGGEPALQGSPDLSVPVFVPEVVPDFDAVFNVYGLNPMDDDDRLEATRIWMRLATGPPQTSEPRSE